MPPSEQRGNALIASRDTGSLSKFLDGRSTFGIHPPPELCHLILVFEWRCPGKGQSSQPMQPLARHRHTCAHRESACQIMRWSGAL